jgi:hypothetical protein
MGQNPYGLSQATRSRHCIRSVCQALQWLERSWLLKSSLARRPSSQDYVRRYCLTPTGRLVLRREFERAMLGPGFALTCQGCGKTGLSREAMLGKRGQPIKRCQDCQIKQALRS